MSQQIIEFDEQCKSCDGTGLYVGLAERDGAAVICHTCNGSGCHHVKFEYQDFDGIKIRKRVKRVFEIGVGIAIGEGNGIHLEDFGGIPYQDWVDGKPFPIGSENRKYVCPAWWYQNADYKKKPDWEECIGIGSFSNCSSFSCKNKCWDRFDKENGK